jgi:hypothetical protein
MVKQNMARILIVDEKPDTTAVFQNALRDKDFEQVDTIMILY